MKKPSKFSFAIHPVGMAVLLLALLFVPSHQVLAALCALLWHEGCHLAAFLCCGAKDCRIELTPFGGMADVKSYENMPPFRQAACAFAGVFGSCAGAFLAWHFLKDGYFSLASFESHMSLALVNCLPAWPLDGARVLVSLAACFGLENGMRRLLSGTAAVMGMCMLAAALYGAWKGWFNPSLLLAGPYLCYASRMGMTAEQVRRMNRSKLNMAPYMQVTAYASRSKPIENLFPRLVGQCADQRYGVLLQLDHAGQLQRLWTEEEMLAFLYRKEAIGTPIK